MKCCRHRFKEISDKADAPFIQAGSDYSNFLARTTDAYQLLCRSQRKPDRKIDGDIAYRKRTRKTIRISLPPNSKDFKDQMLTDYDKAAKEFDKTESSQLVSEYVRNFLSKDPMPGVKIENKLAKKLIPEIKIEDINALAKKWITDDNIAILVTAPDKEGIKLPTEKDIKDIIARSKNCSAYSLCG